MVRLGLCGRVGVGLAGGWLALTSSGAAQGIPAGSTLLNELERAVCLNDWGTAIELSGAAIALPTIAPESRQALLAFRQELVYLNSVRAVIPNSSSCDRALPLTLSVPEPAAEPVSVGWAEAVAALTQPNRRVVRFDPRPEALVNPPIPATLLAAQGPLAGAVPLDTGDGFSVAAGTVDLARSPQVAYAFVARVGDRLTLDVDVTRTAASDGLGEDSHLFLFDASGRLVGENDDADGQQSRLGMGIARTQVYYAVVTSHGNLPVLADDGTLAGWTETGSSAFDYTLTLTGVTPAAVILR